MNLDGPALPSRLTERVLSRLGFGMSPPPDAGGLAALYLAWCMQVPFDNTRKTIALRTGSVGGLPGIDAEDFLDHWLAHGTGGTCWPSSNALFAVLRSAGFDARRVMASMRDVGAPNHASVKVRAGGSDWLADSSMLLNTPLPLGPGTFISNDSVWPAEVEASNGTHVVWWHTPPNEDYLPCRLLVDPATYQDYCDGYERSRQRSPFNEELYARRNRPGALIILVGRTRYLRTHEGIERRGLTSGELAQSLRDDIGLSGQMIDRWMESGCHDERSASPAAPPSESRPRPAEPPSRRMSGR
jgi:N-hydroxyarylamine O-acetyltransferase